MTHFLPWYWSSLTFSSHSTFLPSSDSWIAMCVIAVVGDAPCQCFSFGPTVTTSPGWISSMRPPQRVRMPVAPRARLEGHVRTAGTSWLAGLEQRVDASRAGEMLGRCLLRRLRTVFLDDHVPSSSVLASRLVLPGSSGASPTEAMDRNDTKKDASRVRA